ncbi:hypothetical protein ABPG77_007897 [Micractinium sp. CCAP 211/92]
MGDIDYGTRFEWVKEIGKGTYGVAELMRDTATGELVAVKFIERGEKVDKNVEREVLNHRRLSGHTNIVQFKEVFLTRTHLGIAMEYASGGTLFERIEKFTRFKEDIARYFFQQLVCGVAWMHKKNVCHRDVKLENTLLDGKQAPRLQLCDFGYSKSAVTDSTPNTMVGTPAYIAPEVFSGAEYDGEVADVWSCGVALYTMLTGQYPFVDPDHPNSCPRTVQRILRVQYELPPDVVISDSCIDLIQRIFVKEPEQRITLSEIRQHPWYLVNLPRECQGGGELLQRDMPSQTEDEILAILEAATAPGTAVGSGLYSVEGGFGEAGEFNEEGYLAEQAEVDRYPSEW